MANGRFIKVTRHLMKQDLTTTATEMVGSYFFRINTYCRTKEYLLQWHLGFLGDFHLLASTFMISIFELKFLNKFFPFS